MAEQSLVVPLIVDGLPERIQALGRSWERKLEFHLTVASANVLERAGAAHPDLWELVTRAASGRSIGPIEAEREIRRVRHPAEPDFETLIVMARAPGVAEIHRLLAVELDAKLPPQPTHVTLYSTDPARGIGLDDERQLAERAPPLSAAEQQEVREAMGFERAFGSGS